MIIFNHFFNRTKSRLCKNILIYFMVLLKNDTKNRFSFSNHYPFVFLPVISGVKLIKNFSTEISLLQKVKFYSNK